MDTATLDNLLARIPHYADLLAACHAEDVPVWLVGGGVRDLLLGSDPADIDLVTTDPEPLARRLSALIAAHVVPMDPQRGIWRVAYASQRFFDISHLRDADILADLRGRDFTCNAIAVRLPSTLQSAVLNDPLHGQQDLHAGLLRSASPTAFHDDPARILRAFRFLAQFSLEIEPDTWTALQNAADRLLQVAPERLLAEWWKLCAAPAAMPAIMRMDDAGVLLRLFPELQPAQGITQNAYHHLDVWAHMRLTAENMARLLQQPAEMLDNLQPEFAPLLGNPHRRARLLFLALIHDVGKPITRTEEEGRVHFYGHDRAGAELAAGLCRRLRMSHNDSRVITTAIRHHLRPLSLQLLHGQGKLSDRAMLRFVRDAGDCLLEILALALADLTASLGPASDPAVLPHLHALYRHLLAFYHTRYLPALATPYLTGEDIKRHLHLPPGPHIGHLLHRARDLQILGKLHSREEALRWAAGMVGSVSDEGA
jgi:tRNA nucleotidyltransferase/poly(A) polymerase